MLYRVRLIAVLMICALMGMLPYGAQAANRLYLAGYMGLNVFPDESFKDNNTGISGEVGVDTGKNFAGAIGFKLTPQLRIEGEFNYLKADLNGANFSGLGSYPLTGSIESKIAMLNLYYDFDFMFKKLRPFVGAGIGYGWHDGGVDSISILPADVSEQSGGLVWQVGGGMRYPLSEHLNLIGAYRYLDGQDLEFGGYDIDYGSHEIRLGISWDLPFD
jgi:opacity protein-like surface antigen